MLHKAVAESLEQVEELISLMADLYGVRPKQAQASVGRHIRHVIDHFWALQEGVATGVVDYNLRHRDSDLEKNGDLAQDIVRKLQSWVASLGNKNPSLTVISEISISESQSVELSSNLNRELLYVLNHTLHHVAYASLLARSLAVAVPDYLGVAPATATYQRS